MKGRTIRSFPTPADFWASVERWAAASGFALKEQTSERRLYRKGLGLLMAPACLELRREGTTVTLEAWVKADPYLFVGLLTGKPAESRLDSGGMTAVLPRKQARDAVNRLLADFGQVPID